MKYTRYFSTILKTQGVPNLNLEQYARLMNIVSLEGRLQELLDMRKHDNTFKYDVRISRLEKQLAKLTINNFPNHVLNDMWKEAHHHESELKY